MTTTRAPSISASPTWRSRRGWMYRLSHGKRSSLPFPLTVRGSKFVPTIWRASSRTPHTRYPLASPRRSAPFDNAEIRCPIISGSALFSLYSTISDSGPRDRIRRTSRPQSRSTELRIIMVGVYSGASLTPRRGRGLLPHVPGGHPLRRDLRNTGVVSSAAMAALGPLPMAGPGLVRLLAAAPAPVVGCTGGGLLAGSGQGGLRRSGRARSGSLLGGPSGGALGVGMRGRQRSRRARRSGRRYRRRGGGPVDEGPAVSQEKIVKLDVAGLGAEDVSRRPHRDGTTDRVATMAEFMVLENADPEAAVEEDGELG